MKPPPEPDCPRWRALRAHLRHINKREIKTRAAWHQQLCPQCAGWSVPLNLSRDPSDKPHPNV